MASFLRYGTLVLALSLPAFASPLLDERANRNNLVRCFDPTGTKPTDLASKSAATAFCSSFLSIPVVTSIVATTTPVTTVTSTVTTTDATEVQTSISTATVLVVEKSTTTTTTTAPAMVTNTVPKKRDVAVQPPACATQETYAPSALSSACAYISVRPSTTYVTATAPTSTDVNISIIHETTTTTTDTTALTTTTTTETSTVVTTASPAPVCRDGTVTTSNGKVFCVQHATGISGYSPNFEIVGRTTSLLACIELCATIYAPRCIGTNWLTFSTQCLVLYQNIGTVANTDWESAYLLQ